MKTFNAIKNLLAVSVVAAMSSTANAWYWGIQGRLDSITNTASTLVVNPYGTPWIPETIAAAQAGATQPILTGYLDISGGVISDGSITLEAHGVKTFLGDFYGTSMDVSTVTYSFGTGFSYGTAGFAQSGGSVVAGSCQGTLPMVICPSAYAGSPVLDYQVTEIVIPNSAAAWSLNLRFGTADPRVTGGLTVMSFTLCSPYIETPTCLPPPFETPIPAAAWLFGSSLIGLATRARRKAVKNKAIE